MGIRATWKGRLNVRLVSIPIKVYPATEESEKLGFHQLHTECQSRIQQQKWCPHCEREISSDEVAKGFEVEPGRFVIVLPEEFDAVKPPSTRVIDLVHFADAGELEPYAIDRSYYLAPDGPKAAEAFAVLRVAMRRRVGIGKLAIYGREYLIAVRPAMVPVAAKTPSVLTPVLMLHTLHHAAELRPMAAIDELKVAAPAPPEHVRLAVQVIAACTRTLDLTEFTDAYRADLQRLIAAKVAGHELVDAPAIAPAPLLPLRTALTQSLQQANRRQKKR